MSNTQAPVAGADPRAWREMAELLDEMCDRIDRDGTLRVSEEQEAKVRAAAAALRAAAEAVTEWDGRAGWLASINASIVSERTGGTPDVPAWVAQSAENYRTLTRERDEAERMGHDAVEWIGVVRDLLVDAGYQPGDRDVALANLRTLVAAAARGAEGERRRDVAEEAVARVRELASMAPGAARVMGLAAILADYDATLAPRPSAGPAAGAVELLESAWGLLCNVSEGDWHKQEPRWQDAMRDYRRRYHEWLGIREPALAPAARASDDPAPTTEVEPVEMLYAMAGVVGTCRLCGKRLSNGGHMTAHGEAHVRKGEARHVGNPFGYAECRYALTAAAPAAPEVPRGE